MLTLTPELAQRFARSTLGHVSQEYPHGLGHFMRGPEDISPRGLHPIFFGSFDWHSCVHGWWQLFRLARLFPDLAPEIVSRARETFTPDNIQGELDYLQDHPSFERPYGWAWLLVLHIESEFVLGSALQPPAKLIAERLKSYLPRLTHPVRAGTHSNTAFALILAYVWGQHHDPDLNTLIRDWTMDRLGEDRAAPWLEPSGEDFLSPTLTEAVLVAQVLSFNPFVAWFERYLPELPANLLAPVTVSDRSDGRIGHLDGLNLSRAWCWRTLAEKIPSITEVALKSADRHIEAALPHLEANYMSEHWLCSFALLALPTS